MEGNERRSKKTVRTPTQNPQERDSRINKILKILEKLAADVPNIKGEQKQVLRILKSSTKMWIHIKESLTNPRRRMQS